ncbi:NADPH-dependent F420 reductase [Sphingomonas sp. BK580]|uniref:NADPH-dependent F420 reductase n=1 Tax=Sphingomonas sp. BK580 TaxID=2586972 RepID=UPI0016119411|nr:NAD(P)-binding domain-containing protein [Sphingomonas sp. BK580]MBB3695592.1 hypothetical protein [Sphingomonas sp. BK580]
MPQALFGRRTSCTKEISKVTYSIVGFGKIGQAIAKAFARSGIEVAVATTRPPQQLASTAATLGAAVKPIDLAEALEADVIFLAVPFKSHRDVAGKKPNWTGKIIVDATNAYGVDPADLGGRPSSAAIEEAFAGAQLVKGFNHLPASTLAQDPNVNGGRRVIFIASDAKDPASEVSKIAEKLGFAPIYLGKLAEGGALVQARGSSWAQLIFQDLVKFS